MSKLDWSLDAYDYELPPQCIAQNPVTPRDHSRLLVIDSPETHQHCIFRTLPEFLKSGDLLVLNNTRVIPARMYGEKSTGAKVEILLLEEKHPNTWLALVKPGKRFHIGSEIIFPAIIPSPLPDLQKLVATVIDTDAETGGRLLHFALPDHISLIQVLEYFGQIPFPPYVTDSQADPAQYQTVYANPAGSVAAPTAGLHFTPELLNTLQAKGIEQAVVTLHVGLGTFRPLEVTDVTTHQMHSEWLEVSQATVEKIQETKAKGGRVIAVGTTTVRALEGVANITRKNSLDCHEDQAKLLQPFCGYTDLFIYPGYQWQVVDGLITNFHLPKSSLLMLVSALIGRERLLNLYKEAIAQEYRFYSFGDAMLILPEARIN